MTELADHARRNKETWTRWAHDYVEAGRKAWISDSIYWGIWSIPESEIGALGDLARLRGKDVIEMGCGTGYFSAWMAKLGARPVGIDVTPAQLETARGFQAEFGIEFPLIEGSAESVPYPAESFDLAISEYGASIWCDPAIWIKEAARLLRPGGELVFMRNSTIECLCLPQTGAAETKLVNPQFGMYRIEGLEGEVEFQPSHSQIIKILRANGFRIDDLIEIQAPEDAKTRYDFVTLEWARQWPSEEIWRATKE